MAMPRPPHPGEFIREVCLDGIRPLDFEAA